MPAVLLGEQQQVQERRARGQDLDAMPLRWPGRPTPGAGRRTSRRSPRWPAPASRVLIAADVVQQQEVRMRSGGRGVSNLPSRRSRSWIMALGCPVEPDENRTRPGRPDRGQVDPGAGARPGRAEVGRPATVVRRSIRNSAGAISSSSARWPSCGRGQGHGDAARASSGPAAARRCAR